MMYKNTKKSKKLLLVMSLLLAAVLAFGVWYFLLRTTDNAEVIVDTEATTTSDAATAQSDFSDGDEREPGNTISEDEGSGGIEDNAGVVEPGTNTSNAVTSSSGEITLYTPTDNAVVSSGQKVSGSSELSSVSYRIIDNVSGVISTGKLQVVKGKFSGTMKFSTTATKGRLDIYGVRDDGREFSNIDVDVRF